MNILRTDMHDKKDIEQSKLVHNKVNMSLVSLVYKQTSVGLMASLLCATLLFIGLYDVSNFHLLLGWYSVSVFVVVLRLILALIYKQQSYPERRTQLWRWLFTVGVIIGGALWGMTSIFFLQDASNIHQTLVILFLAGITAGAVPYLSSIPFAGITFLLLSLIPLIVMLLFQHDLVPIVFNISIIVYLVYLIVVLLRTHEIIRTSISLQFENHSLLSNLSEAKSELEIINQKLEQAATHDPLTNVGNRNLFLRNFNAAIERCKESKKILSLLYIDLDHFKTVNDTHGHHVGDQLLLTIVDRLEKMFRTNDIISRLGGDEFAVVLENIASPHDVAKVAKRVCEVIAEPIMIHDIEIHISVSIGISVYPIDGVIADALINIADTAMYHVKEQGGNNYRFNIEQLPK